MTAELVTGAPDVAQYAAAVRRHLGDLPPEQVDDLTDDLELDLQDALDDERRVGHGRTLADLLGTPQDYATELRAAAGLATAPPQGRSVRRAVARPVHAVRALGVRTLAALRRRAWWPPVESFAVALRPVWWLVRAWVVFMLLAGVANLDSGYFTPWIPRSLSTVVLLGVCVVVSVQWGRGQWLRAPRLRWLVVGVNVVAAVALLPTVSSVYTELDRHQQIYREWAQGNLGPGVEYREHVVDGVVVDGMQVSNLFVYDAEGNPLTDVQIYDDRGRPVRTTFDEGYQSWSFPGSDEPWQFVSASSRDGVARWNVYPLRGAPASTFVWGDTGPATLPDGVQAQLPPMPFAKAPAVAVERTTSGSDEPQIDGTVVADGEHGLTVPSPEPTAATHGPSSSPTP